MGLIKESAVSNICSKMTICHVVLNIHPFLNEATGHVSVDVFRSFTIGYIVPR